MKKKKNIEEKSAEEKQIKEEYLREKESKDVLTGKGIGRRS